MSEIPYNIFYSDAYILKAIGGFLKAKRIEQNITQEELATKAAISRSTLSLAEKGENISLLNLLKILRVLDAFYVLEHFQQQPTISPLLLAKEEAKQRKRASGNKKNNDKEDWQW